MNSCNGTHLGGSLPPPPLCLRLSDQEDEDDEEEKQFQVSPTAGCTALAGPNRDETSVRGLRRIAAEAPRDWRPPNPSPMNPVPGGTQSFASAAENRQVPMHFPGTSIARPPAPEAKFQISRAPGALTLAGSNSDETTGLIVTNRLREAATKLATRLTTKFQRNSASRVTADMCLAANSVVLVRLFRIALLRRELCRAESRSRYLPNGSTKFT